MTINKSTGLTSSNYVVKDVRPPATTQELAEEAQNAPVSKGVGVPSRKFNEMMARWELPLHLMGGTLSMREAGKKYLPKEPGEEEWLYKNRLARTVLYGIYSRTVKSLSAIPFIDPIILKDVPRELRYLEQHATDEDKSLRQFAQDQLQDQLNLGVSHFLVDFPFVPDAAALSLAEERALGINPFFVHISPTSLIGWKSVNGTLTEIRIFYKDVMEGPDFSEVIQERVRVVRPDQFVDYIRVAVQDSKKKQTTEWRQQAPRVNPLGYIPLVTSYGNSEDGPMTGRPALEELAWINLKHYQKQSDLDNIEHVANTPFLFAKGFDEKELEDVVVGVNTLIASTKSDAEIEYVEHTGAAIQVTHNSIKTLEQRAAVMGAEFLSQAATNRQTAYSKSVDTGRSLSILQAMVNNLSESLKRGFEIAADWLEMTVPDNMKTTIGEGIELSLDNNDFAALVGMAKDGILTVQDLQYELQRRGKISDSTVLKEPKPEEPPAEPGNGSVTENEDDVTGEQDDN